MPIIDRAQLMDHIEDDVELLGDIFEFFCDDSDSLVAEMQQAIASSDFDSVRTSAHTVKGMLSNFMAEAACQTAQQIENTQDGTQTTFTALLDKLSSQIETVKSEIQQILESDTT